MTRITHLELMNLYSRIWLGTGLVARMIREKQLKNIFPANLVRHEPYDSMRLAVESRRYAGVKWFIFEKPVNEDTWTCVSHILTMGPFSTEDLIDFAECQVHSLGQSYLPPEATMEAAWEIYRDNHPGIWGMVEPLTTDGELCAYPLVFIDPECEYGDHLVVAGTGNQSWQIRPSHFPAQPFEVVVHRESMTLSGLKEFLGTPR